MTMSSRTLPEDASYLKGLFMISTATRTIHWAGKSGKQYKYWVFDLPLKVSLKSEPGNYCFARETEPGRFMPIYFGETEDLSSRFNAHHKMACIMKQGVTHLHAHTSSSGASVRRLEEADLISHWTPPCNG
jgi:hypothetical protein